MFLQTPKSTKIALVTAVLPTPCIINLVTLPNPKPRKRDDFMRLKSKDSVMVYTDGSVYGGEAGSGACSAIL